MIRHTMAWAVVISVGWGCSAAESLPGAAASSGSASTANSSGGNQGQSCGAVTPCGTGMACSAGRCVSGTTAYVPGRGAAEDAASQATTQACARLYGDCQQLCDSAFVSCGSSQQDCVTQTARSYTEDIDHPYSSAFLAHICAQQVATRSCQGLDPNSVACDNAVVEGCDPDNDSYGANYGFAAAYPLGALPTSVSPYLCTDVPEWFSVPLQEGERLMVTLPQSAEGSSTRVEFYPWVDPTLLDFPGALGRVTFPEPGRSADQYEHRFPAAPLAGTYLLKVERRSAPGRVTLGVGTTVQPPQGLDPCPEDMDAYGDNHSLANAAVPPPLPTTLTPYLCSGVPEYFAVELPAGTRPLVSLVEALAASSVRAEWFAPLAVANPAGAVPLDAISFPQAGRGADAYLHMFPQTVTTGLHVLRLTRLGSSGTVRVGVGAVGLPPEQMDVCTLDDNAYGQNSLPEVAFALAQLPSTVQMFLCRNTAAWFAVELNTGDAPMVALQDTTAGSHTYVEIYPPLDGSAGQVLPYLGEGSFPAPGSRIENYQHLYPAVNANGTYLVRVVRPFAPGNVTVGIGTQAAPPQTRADLTYQAAMRAYSGVCQRLFSDCSAQCSAADVTCGTSVSDCAQRLADSSHRPWLEDDFSLPQAQSCVTQLAANMCGALAPVDGACGGVLAFGCAADPLRFIRPSSWANAMPATAGQTVALHMCDEASQWLSVVLQAGQTPVVEVNEGPSSGWINLRMYGPGTSAGSLDEDSGWMLSTSMDAMDPSPLRTAPVTGTYLLQFDLVLGSLTTLPVTITLP